MCWRYLDFWLYANVRTGRCWMAAFPNTMNALVSTYLVSWCPVLSLEAIKKLLSWSHINHWWRFSFPRPWLLWLWESCPGLITGEAIYHQRKAGFQYCWSCLLSGWSLWLCLALWSPESSRSASCDWPLLNLHINQNYIELLVSKCDSFLCDFKHSRVL